MSPSLLAVFEVEHDRMLPTNPTLYVRRNCVELQIFIMHYFDAYSEQVPSRDRLDTRFNTNGPHTIAGSNRSDMFRGVWVHTSFAAKRRMLKTQWLRGACDLVLAHTYRGRSTWSIGLHFTANHTAAPAKTQHPKAVCMAAHDLAGSLPGGVDLQYFPRKILGGCSGEVRDERCCRLCDWRNGDALTQQNAPL